MNGTEALDEYLDGLLQAVACSAAQAPPAAASATGEVPAAACGDPTPAAGPDASAATIADDVIAEMMADPAFAAEAPAPADVGADVIAEMLADPAFADAPADRAKSPVAGVASAPALVDPMAADLIAEMENDPAFAPAKPAALESAPARSKAATNPPAMSKSRLPARSAAGQPARLPPHIQALFRPDDADRAQVPPQPAERSSRWLRLRCGEQAYALELLKVQEVVLPTPLLRLRGTSRSMLGIMNLRGLVVPVLDLGLYLGSQPVAADPDTRVVVLEEQGETMGLRVSAVEDVTTLTDQQIEPPDNTRLCKISNQFFRGVARLGQRPVILLDASQLLQ
ncbi:chemotaxis protein CheW [[Pseudomonas] boreopolis]|uniref:Chemotaxis protein CheW n=1 Tax=Xanthomonas boreopolis TaxID=86183 RepID=A0A919KGN9_9XANT|nr:chemotaxis protein [[Pseudomonas] boreopolis]